MKSEMPFAIRVSKLMAEGKKHLSALIPQTVLTQTILSKDFSLKSRSIRVVLLGLILVAALSAYFIGPYLRAPRDNLIAGNYSAAYSQYIQKAEAGNALAQNVIGNLYLLGLGVEEDKSRAARWYLKAALNGYTPAQINLGQIYLNGQGLPRRPLKAMGWFHLARQAGSERADEHIKYMIYSNLILTNMIQEAKLKFDNLQDVNTRYKKMGETAFLTKMDSSLIEESN